MKCKVSECNTNAYALYTWGLYPDGEHNKEVPLCVKCADELWKEVGDLVKSLKMHFVITSMCHM